MNKPLYLPFLCACLFVLATGCNDDDNKQPTGPTHGPVTITPATAIPAGAVYYFYPADGGAAVNYNAVVDGMVSGELPLGTYRALAFSAGVESVEFRNLATFEGASVHLLPMDETTGLPTVMKPVDDVYVLTIDEVVVADGQEATHAPAPVLLTHTLTLNIDLSRLPFAVSEVTATLTGAYSGRVLATGQPTADAASLASTTAAYSKWSLPSIRSSSGTQPLHPAATRNVLNGTYTLTFRTLGMVDLSTTGQKNLLQLTIPTSITSTTDFNRDMTASIDVTPLFAAAADAGGTLPPGTVLDVTVDLDDTNLADPAPDGDIDGWEQGNPGSGNNNIGLQ